MADFVHTEEKLSLAVYDLARGAGTRKDRLLHVWIKHLVDLGEESFPEHLHAEFRKLRDRLHCTPPTAEQDRATATISRMSDHEALQAIDAILALHALMEW